MAHFSGGDVDEQWFTDWVDRPIPLDEAVLESKILAERKPAVVYDTESADVHRPIIVDAGHSSSYVVAPIIVDDVVIGFLHADYKPTDRRVDAVDRDVLWSFAQGFAQLYERAVLRERLGDQRERMRQALAASDDLLEDRALDLVIATGAPPTALPLTARCRRSGRDRLSSSSPSGSAKCSRWWRSAPRTSRSQTSWWWPRAPSRRT